MFERACAQVELCGEANVDPEPPPAGECGTPTDFKCAAGGRATPAAGMRYPALPAYGLEEEVPRDAAAGGEGGVAARAAALRAR